MRTIGVLFILVFLTEFSFQQCTVGCLKCNSQNQCLVCDTTLNYFLSGTSCQLGQRQNCLQPGQSGSCLRCSNGYFLDPNTNSCLSVPTGNVVNRCLTYSSSLACTSCGPNFYLSLGVCVAVSSTVPFCRLYSSDGVCGLCEPGYIRDATDTFCTALPSNNCLFFTFLKCDRCGPGYIANPNLYFTNWSSSDYFNRQYLNNILAPDPFWKRLEVCQRVAVTNCDVLLTATACSKCLPNFFLQNGSCMPYPHPAIVNCAIYSGPDTCTGCTQGFYLDNNTCKPVSLITNCSVYSTTTANTCVSCTTGNFLAANSCSPRVLSVSIQNCLSVQANADACQACSPAFQLTSDGLKCLPVVSNCQTYATSSTSDTALTCTLCANGFYLSAPGQTATCVSGTTPNCLTFNANNNVCAVCNSQYYLNNQLCVKHIDIPNCNTYSKTVANTCLSCNLGYHPFSYHKVCIPSSAVPNCLSYKIDGKCAKCLNNFYLVVNDCVPIPELFSNCLEFDGTKCTKCDSSKKYVLAGTFDNFNCTLIPDYITNFCQELEPLDGTQTIQRDEGFANLFCKTCGDYMAMLPVFSSTTICVKTDELKLYRGYSPVVNCKRYGLNGYAFAGAFAGTNVVCKECENGLYLKGYEVMGMFSTNQLSCSQTCDLETSVIVPDTDHGSVNLCIAKTVGPDVTGLPLFYVSSTNPCVRMARFRVSEVPTDPEMNNPTTTPPSSKENNNYLCFMVLPNTNPAAPTRFLGIDGDLTSLYRGDFSGGMQNNPNKGGVFRPNGAVIALNVAAVNANLFVDFSGSYSNTVDGSSIFPSVFNYNGLLPFVIPMTIDPAVTSQFYNNHLSSCDIIYRYTSTANNQRLGWAFADGIGVNADANPVIRAAIPTSGIVICLRCQFGHMLSYTPTGSKSTNPVFPSCVPMSTACVSPAKVLGGLPTYLNTFFSCHVCGELTDTSKLYPSIWIETDSIASGTAPPVNDGTSTGSFVGWKIKSVYTSLTTVSPKHGFKCAPSPDFVYTGSSTPKSSVSGCAAFGYLSLLNKLKTTGDPTETTTSEVSVCLACDPNSYPTYGYATNNAVGLGLTFTPPFNTNTVPENNNLGLKKRILDTTTGVPRYYVKSCTPSTFCDPLSRETFNGCTKCLPDDYQTGEYYAFSFSGPFTCQRSNSPNCLVALTNNNCHSCKAGHYARSGICVRFQIPNTPNSSFFNIDRTTESVLTKGTLPDASRFHKLYLKRISLKKFGQNLFYGPTSCNAGYHKFPSLRNNRNICTAVLSLFRPTATEPIEGCIAYSFQGEDVDLCQKCRDGNILKEDKSSCVLSIPNYKFARNDVPTSCHTCLDNFFLVNNVCVPANIPNCLTHDAVANTLVCLECMPAFYLSGDLLSCPPGLVMNCKKYTDFSSTECTECSEGFVLVPLNNQVFYCYPIPESLSCVTLNNPIAAAATVARLDCSQCRITSTNIFTVTDWNTLNTAGQPQNLCMPFSKIPNCEVYSETNLDVNANTFSCTRCSSTFWYSASNFTCSLRFNVDSKCAKFTNNADTCDECLLGSYLRTDKRSCVPYPTGVINCIQYSSATACTKCLSGFYLSNNVCLLSTVVPNCVEYSANFTCTNCQTGFFLLNQTTCQSSIALNCLIAASANACLSCPSGLGLLKDLNNVTNCVNILDNLPNCLQATTISPFNCTLCRNGYFIDTNFTCTKVPLEIFNCAKYDSAVTCEVCVPGTVLNLTRTTCDKPTYANFIDNNCLETRLLREPQCAQCSLGYFFRSGSCVPCSSSTSNPGCLACDPANDAVCFICQPKFYMNAQGVCVSSTLIVNTISGNPSGLVGSSWLLKTLTICATIPLLLNRI